MGEGSTETVQEIEDVRSRLGDQIDELEGRLTKSPDVAKKAAGGAAAAAGTFLLLRGLRRRMKRKKTSKIGSSIETAAEYIPERIKEAAQEQDWRFWAGVAVAAVFLFRMAELRQLRRINRALRK